MFSEDLTLVAETFTSDQYGQQIASETETTVQAEKKSLTRTEFYQAAATDLNPEIVFDMHAFEYTGQRRLRWNGREYSIIRTYEHVLNGLELVELVCERRVGHG